LYYGIEDRDKATEAALIFHFYSKVGLVDITVVRDVSNTYDDFRSSISWSRPFPDTGNWTIVPRMYGRYYSIKYNDYYYGVSEKEMNNVELEFGARVPVSGVDVSFEDYEDIWRPAYKAGNAGQFGVDLSIDYHFTENFKAQGYIGMEQLAGQVTSSPLINDADIWKVSLGIAADF
jgi:outer membrane scaffolding protein for murein synthesis (MipA/OmpV family)